ncbi:MAG: PHP domain-containing protein [Sandaracinaceae bacterium]|nr:PHP domain-containing protein [Sandaracinaceae bacterium]MBP7683304.1 PHP domain-containing protein [Deltaproteobacteria bacterium]
MHPRSTRLLPPMALMGLLGTLSLGCGGGDGAVDLGPADDGMPDSGPEDLGTPDCVTVTTLGAADSAPARPDGVVGVGGLRITNDLVVAGFSSLAQHGAAGANGGNLLDFHVLGSDDHFVEHWIVAGPDSGLRVFNTTMNVTAEEADRVVLEVRGYVERAPHGGITMNPGTGLTAVTTFELRCGEPKLHIATTLTNATNPPVTLAGLTGALRPVDVLLWGSPSNMRPFCPNPGQGTTCTTINFSNVVGTLVRSQYVGSGGSRAGLPGSIAYYSLDMATVAAAHDSTNSAFGDITTGITAFAPGATASHRRVLVAGGAADAASSVDTALEDLEALGRLTTGQVTGTVSVPGGIPSDPHRRPAVILATPPATGNAMDPATWRPVNMVRVAADGSFTARVPAGAVSYEVRMDGQAPVRGTGTAVAAGATVNLGTLNVGARPELNVTVRVDGTGGTARVVVLGTGATPDPVFGPETGTAPQGNVALTDGLGVVSLPIAPGTYDVYAMRGLDASLDRESIVVASADLAVTLDIASLDVVPTGYLMADFHVHSAVSFDSSTPPEDQVRAFMAAGVDALVATEHDIVFDYGPAIAVVDETLPQASRGRIKAFAGLEATAFVPYEDFPHTIGHYNVFPVDVVPTAFESGTPDDERVGPATVYDRLRAMPGPAQRIVQMNHARATRVPTIWLGYLDSCGFDASLTFAMNGACDVASGMGTSPFDVDAFEVINFKDMQEYVTQNRDWHALLREAPGGNLPTGTANSDSHRIYNEEAGFPVNVLATTSTLADLSGDDLVGLIQDGSLAGALGVFVWIEVCDDAVGTNCREPGKTPLNISGDTMDTDTVHVRVRVAAPPWIPVDELRVRLGGEVVAIIDLTAENPADPFSTSSADVLRYDAVINVTNVTADSFITAEAGFVLPTLLDANMDGVVDPITFPAAPQPFTSLVRGAQPIGFVNPVFLDRDGNGQYNPPGMPLPL